MAGATPGAQSAGRSPGPPEPPNERPPFLLDFFPLEDATQTRLSRFFDELRLGRLMTTRCPKDQSLSWPPRVVCPSCHSEEMEWVELPKGGSVYAFSAVLAGAPLGMESEVPFVVGLVDLDGVPLRLFGRIVGKSWEACRLGMSVAAEPFELPDGRVFYRFRTEP
ncbi:MAG: Zn-ribbon domain-containing OB-fold protein [Thermoplasmata archaeon]|nr:Zn-ribbon domain-containing OB-fold protein [Thermoplasmata archaeon]